jgi:DNA-directed RNA polymerase subunit RPC12/RpoP
MGSIQCPYCGSYQTARQRGPWDWLWLVAAAASFVMRMLLSLARYGEYRGEPGIYACGTCGRTFSFFI